MLGVLFSLLAAGTFALNAAAARRGVLTASVVQGLAITVPLGVPLFLAIAWMAGEAGRITAFPLEAVLWFAAAGVVHFVLGRYCNYTAAGAIGNNLAAPLLQCEVLVTLALAMTVLGEQLTPLRLIGITLVLIGPSLVINRDAINQDAINRDAINQDAINQDAGPAKDAAAQKPAFEPRYGEGYLFATLAAITYGSSPILIGLGLKAAGTNAALAGGVVSYLSATAVVGLALIVTRQTRSAYQVGNTALRWFVLAGVFVCLSHVFRYAALALAPVSVVTSLQRLSSIFRISFGWLINPEHEVLDRSVVLATVVSMIGAIALSISTDTVLALAPWPEWVRHAARLHWP